jgi:hypothetical protein
LSDYVDFTDSSTKISVLQKDVIFRVLKENDQITIKTENGSISYDAIKAVVIKAPRFSIIKEGEIFWAKRPSEHGQFFCD